MATAEVVLTWPELGRTPTAEVGPAQCTDQELTRKVAGGDMRAFEEVYRRHHRRVYGLCLRMTQNVADAEDLTQEVFVHLFRQIGSFRGEAAFTTWLHRLTANHVLMHFRKKRRARREVATEDGMTPEPVFKSRGAAGPMPVLDHMALSNAIAQLAPGYRAVFILHDIEGYEHEEIARILGCNAGTSKSQLHKARMRLRKLLTTPPAGQLRRRPAAKADSNLLSTR